MKLFYDSIYLSPHLDDAALSCGGQIFGQTSQGKSVLIVTLMAGIPTGSADSPFIRELHQRWGLSQNAAAARRLEDAAACQVLGADFAHWEVLDCVYRQHPQTGSMLYPSWAAVIGGIHPAENGLIKTLVQKIADLPAHGRLLAPLGIGSHADHLITNTAASHTGKNNLAFYEDYPYAAEPAALSQVIHRGVTDWQVDVLPLRPAEIEARIEAVAAYTSQLSSFFKDRADMETQLHQFIRQRGGERLWHRKKSHAG